MQAQFRRDIRLMSASSTDDKAMTPSSSVPSDVNRVLRLNGARSNSRYFGFPWKHRKVDDKDGAINGSQNDLETENFSNSKISSGFLKNIKKRLRIRNIGLCKAKQKVSHSTVLIHNKIKLTINNCTLFI